jgi:hypothetical protein
MRKLTLLAVIFLLSSWKVLPAQSFDAKVNLGFEDVFAGYSETTVYTESIAGRVRITTNADNRTVRVTFTLPSTLTRTGGGSIPITFSSTSAAYKVLNTTDLSTTGATTFNPATPLTRSMGSNRRLIIWLGGTVSPPGSAPAGTYNGTITITAQYL